MLNELFFSIAVVALAANPVPSANLADSRYVAGAPELMLQVCRPFLSGQNMRPVLQQLDAWPAHAPLQARVLGDREGQVYLTRQFGYGLYAVVLEKSGKCGVEVFDVSLNLQTPTYPAQLAKMEMLTPALYQPAVASNQLAGTAFVRRASQSNLEFSTRITDRGDGRGSVTFTITRIPAEIPSVT